MGDSHDEEWVIAALAKGYLDVGRKADAARLLKLQLSEKLVRSRKTLDQQARKRLLTEAEDLLRRVLQMNAPQTRQAWAWFNLGQTLRGRGAPKSEIRRAFEEANRILPSEPRFLRELRPRSS